MATTKMTYRFLGNSGLLVSKLSLGAWMFFDKTDSRYTADNWYKMITTALKHGINFFDNAENYTAGYSEELTGLAIQRRIHDGLWSREDLVVTTKIFAGIKGFMGAGPNDQGVSRMHIVEGMKASLRRLQLDNVDVVFCHRSEPYTPIEETYKLGLTTFSPLSFGVLSGKYSAGRPSDSRFAMPMFKDMQLVPSFEERVAMADMIKLIAAELGYSIPQLALAWCASNENASTVMIRASRPEQLEENLKALDFVDKVTPEVKAKIDAIINFVPTTPELNSLVTLRGRHLTE
ncbi:hypothetical protein PI126_g19020 [Phytophthora idaei]|nr:hypothetical protein PI126_g19020 [Phytophthora idaei]